MTEPVPWDESPRTSAVAPDDVRARGFARRCTVAAALSWLEERLTPLPPQRVPLAEAFDRVLAESVVSQAAVPNFDRAMMDGFAVVATDTQGAGPYNRLVLEIVGELLPGQPPCTPIRSGQALRIMTGAPLPPGADAVLPFEHTEVEASRLFALGEVSPGKHVGQRGEDVSSGTVVLPAGRRLRPQDLGVLSSIGCGELAVTRRPEVRILVTGDELLPAGSPPLNYKISDANGPMLSALVQRDGGTIINSEIIADAPAAILAAMSAPADVVLISGGSSVGQEDHAPRLLAAHGCLAIHGIAMRPSSPAGMGTLDSRLVFLLPGNPVSCLCAYDFFAGRAIRALGGRDPDWPYRRIKLPLVRKLSSAVGRVDYARVKRTPSGIEPLAIGGASVLTSTTRADGFVIVPADSEGYPPGSEVDVFLYD